MVYNNRKYDYVLKKKWPSRLRVKAYFGKKIWLHFEKKMTQSFKG